MNQKISLECVDMIIEIIILHIINKSNNRNNLIVSQSAKQIKKEKITTNLLGFTASFSESV